MVSRKTTYPSRVCSVLGCGRVHHAHGFCMTHYQRLRRGIDLGAPMRRPVDPERGCSVPGCDREHHANGLCNMHNKRRWRSERVPDLQPDQ